MTRPYEIKRRFVPIDELTADLSDKLRRTREADEYVPVRTRRMTTRFLNFNTSPGKVTAGDQEADTAAYEPANKPDAPAWLTIVDGAGHGTVFALKGNYARIGRQDDQEVALSFGDDSISRDGHAIVCFYGEEQGFIIRDGGKPNPVYFNGRRIQGERRLSDGDLIRIGETTLRFALA